MNDMGSLVVSVEANTVRFEEGCNRAEHLMRQSMDSISKFAGIAGAAISFISFVDTIKGAIDTQDHMNDLSKTTSIAVEQLAGLSLASKQSGGDLDSIAASINKLSVNMGKDAEKFAALGVSAKDPLKAFQQLSDIFVAIQEPQQRAAVMAAALGKSWAGAAPLLAEGGKRIGEMVANGAQLSNITKESAARADEFKDKMAELSTTLEGTRNKLVGDMLPSLIKISAAMQEAAKDGGLLKAALVGVGGVMSGVFTDDNLTRAEQISKKLAYLRSEEATALKWGGMLETVGLWPNKEKELASYNDAMLKLEKELAAIQAANEKTAKSTEGLTDAQKKAAAEANDRAAAFLKGLDDLEALNKKLLANQLKTLEDAAKTEVDILGKRNKMLDFFYGENLLSIHDYFAGKNSAQDEALARTIADYDKEIAVLEKYRANTLKDVNKTEATGKINQLLETKKKLLMDTGEIMTMNSLQETKSIKELRTALEGLNVQYLTMNNQLDQAAALSFDLSNAQMKVRLTTEGDYESLFKLEALRARAIENASTMAEAGYSRSLRNYVNSTMDSARQIENLMTNAFKGIEDALVNFTMTGKLDFNSFTNSIIANLIRIQVQRDIMQPLVGTSDNPGLLSKGVSSLVGMLGFGSSAPYTAGFSPAQLAGPVMASYASGTDYVPYDMVAQIHQGEKIIPASQNNGSNSAPNVTVQVINQSGQAVTAKQQGGPQFNGKDWVLGVVLEAADSNPHFRNAMGMGMGN